MKLLLIDGHYYVYRSFFAIQNLSNSRGEPTNAIYGFTKTIRRMMKDLQPEYGAVVWDEGLPQRRIELQPAYKETRKEMLERHSGSLDIKTNPPAAMVLLNGISRGVTPMVLKSRVIINSDSPRLNSPTA